jgi:hypothetical protein
MFTLNDATGQPARMRDGEPFRYSTRELARLGKNLLEARKEDNNSYRIVEESV